MSVEGGVATVMLDGRPTRVGLVRLWEVDDEAFRERVADAFSEVWPDRRGECNSIRRGLYSPDRKPTPLVLTPVDGPDARATVLGYTIVYPSSTVRRPPREVSDDADPSSSSARDPSHTRSRVSPSREVTNCTLNSVLVPAHLRGARLGRALVRLAARVAVDELGFECVTAWCQPRLVDFYRGCGFQYEPPASAATSAGARKDALWAKLLGREHPTDTEDAGDDSSSASSDDDELDECMRFFS